jgi:RPA family protein
MKKYIFSVLMAAMAAFTFSSCEDVPEPYTLPTKPETPGNTDPNQKGSESNPYTVTEAIALIKTGTAPSTAVCVKGKITAVTFFNATYSSLSYNIADEGSSDVIEVYSGKGKDGANFSSKDDLKVGQTVVVKGIVKAFTKNDGTIVNEIDKNSTIISIENTGTTSPDTPTTGKGSLSDPYNVAEAIAAIKAGTAPTAQVYLTGIISDVAFYNDQYKSITYYISDDGKSKDMQVYSGKGLNGADFASKEDLKVGQKVTILGKIMKFTDKNGNDIMEVDKTSSIVKIEGEGGGEVKPDPTPDTPASGNIEMTDASILSGKSGDVELVERYYNSQNVTNESTWYTWKIGDTTFKGAKICISDGTNGKGIQMQGNASDASKQGFLFNSTAFAKDIKTVTILFSTKATSTYAPSYTLYAAKAANGKDTAIEGKSTNEVSGDYKTYTETFDLSAQNVKYFTLFNNKAGALYIEKIIITLK